MDDALQELWLDVFRSVRKLKEPRAFGAWLYRLARDRAYRDLRQTLAAAGRERTSDHDALAGAEAPEASFSADDAAEIHAALGGLDPEYREVLLLRFVEGMSYEELAAVIGCELGTVRSRLHYAKQKLKALINQRNAHERERPVGRTAQARR